MNKEKTFFFIVLVSTVIIFIIATVASSIISKNADKNELTLDRSIYNKKASGYAAFYKVIQHNKIKNIIWKNSFDALYKTGEKPSTMLITSPEYTPDFEGYKNYNFSKLFDWVAKGNTLIIIDDFYSPDSNDFLKNLDITPIFPESDSNKDFENNFRAKKLYSENKFVLNYPKSNEFKYKTNKISTTSLVRLENQNIIPIIKDDKGILFGKRTYKKGTIYILTIPDLADNSSLYEKEDNYQFLANLLTLNPNPVYINEFIHGYTKNANIFDYYEPTLLNPLSKQILLMTIILIWSVSRRFGRIRPIKNQSRKRNMEYVEAISNLYKKANLTGTVLTPIYNSFKHAICRKYKIDSKINDSELMNAIKSNPSINKNSELSDTIEKTTLAIKSNNISRNEMLELCKKLNKYRLKE